MQFDILPYVLFMVVPVLGRMSDPDESMRLLATQTFATLVKLVPLEVRRRSRPAGVTQRLTCCSISGWNPGTPWHQPGNARQARI